LAGVAETFGGFRVWVEKLQAAHHGVLQPSVFQLHPARIERADRR
jgi:hypothetical protein